MVPARAVRDNFDYSQAEQVTSLIVPDTPAPQQYQGVDDVAPLDLDQAADGDSNGSDVEKSDEKSEEGGDGGGKEGERPSKKARGERIGRDVDVKVVHAVRVKQFSKSAGARGLTTKEHTAMAVLKHNGADG